MWEQATKKVVKEVEDQSTVSRLVAQVKKYSPLDMPGQSKSLENGAVDCQSRCKNTAGCSYFSFWEDGTCHLQDSDATTEIDHFAISGPSRCPNDPCGHCYLYDVDDRPCKVYSKSGSNGTSCVNAGCTQEVGINFIPIK